MRAFSAWAWILFFLAGAIYFWLYFADGRTNSVHFAIGIAFLLLAGVNFLRSRKRRSVAPPPPRSP